jgi:predicted amidophosphoribosyltransferase
VIASVAYSPIAQKVLLAAKESQIKGADELVSGAIAHGIAEYLRRESCDYLVPIPSRSTVVRKRGRQFISEMAEESSQRFQLPVIELLTHTRKVRDQSGLHLQERWNNLEGAFVVRNSQPALGKALLIDDLVTTGATLVEAARALRYAGIEVVGAVTAAIAQPLRYRDEMG